MWNNGCNCSNNDDDDDVYDRANCYDCCDYNSAGRDLFKKRMWTLEQRDAGVYCVYVMKINHTRFLCTDLLDLLNHRFVVFH